MNTPFGFIKDPGAKQFFFEILCNHFWRRERFVWNVGLGAIHVGLKRPLSHSGVPLPSFHGKDDVHIRFDRNGDKGKMNGKVPGGNVVLVSCPLEV